MSQESESMTEAAVRLTSEGYARTKTMCEIPKDKMNDLLVLARWAAKRILKPKPDPSRVVCETTPGVWIVGFWDDFGRWNFQSTHLSEREAIMATGDDR